MGFVANIRGLLMTVFRYSFGKPVYIAASATPETAVDLRAYETVTLLVKSPTYRTFEASVTIMDAIGINGDLQWPAYSYVRWIPADGEIKEKGNYTGQLMVTKDSGGYEDFGAQFTLIVSDTVRVCT